MNDSDTRVAVIIAVPIILLSVACFACYPTLIVGGLCTVVIVATVGTVIGCPVH